MAVQLGSVSRDESYRSVSRDPSSRTVSRDPSSRVIHLDAFSFTFSRFNIRKYLDISL